MSENSSNHSEDDPAYNIAREMDVEVNAGKHDYQRQCQCGEAEFIFPAEEYRYDSKGSGGVPGGERKAGRLFNEQRNCGIYIVRTNTRHKRLDN